MHTTNSARLDGGIDELMAWLDNNIAVAPKRTEQGA